MCVCLSAIISSELHVQSSPIFCACYFLAWLGSLLAASDKLCTSGFIDDVIVVVVVIVVTFFSHNFVNCKATLILAIKIYEIKYNI